MGPSQHLVRTATTELTRSATLPKISDRASDTPSHETGGARGVTRRIRERRSTPHSQDQALGDQPVHAAAKAKPHAEWEEDEPNQSGFELESEALAKWSRHADIAFRDLQGEDKVRRAELEMTRAEVRQTEHAMTHWILRMAVHEAVEGVNG